MDWIDELLWNVSSWGRPVATFGDLPSTDDPGTARITLDTFQIWIWNGSSWELGSSGALVYKGVWDATNPPAGGSPTLADGVGTQGDYYVVGAAGVQDLGSGPIDFNPADWAVYNGTIWQKADHTDTVVSVFGRQGVVTAQANDYTHAQLDAIGADDHHDKSHAHDGVDGSGTVAHADTTGRTENDHHDRQHALDSASDHTGTINDTQHGNRAGGTLHPAVTPDPGGVNGFMSAADKLKLDGIPAGGGGINTGTSFPPTPAEGTFFYRTDLDALFYYDSSRSKWLGELESEGGGRNGLQVAGTYTRRFDGMAYSATLGAYLPYDVTIVGITWAMVAGVAGTWEVRRNGAVVASKATGAAAAGSDMTLDGDAASGGIFSLYWNAGSNCTDPQLRIYFRRHAT